MNEDMKAAWLEISQMLGETTKEELDVFLRTWQRAVQATREALAEQPAPVAKPHEQEPVAWLKVVETPGGWGKFVEAKPNEKGAKPVYTSPPAQRTWVGLTDEEMREIYKRTDWDMAGGWEYERAIESKLKEKNT